jgi:hypothetical protein
MNNCTIEEKVNDYITFYFALHGVLPEEVHLTINEYRAFRTELANKPFSQQNIPNNYPIVITYQGVPVVVAPYSDIKTFWDYEIEERELFDEYEAKN